jgi:choline-sulfatase
MSSNRPLQAARFASLFAVFAIFACAPAPPPQRSVLLVTVDTLRADYVHAYGFPLPNTPRIDELAARGVIFENAIAAAAVTVPSHASIMTSRYAREHSVGTLNGETRLAGDVTLAEQLQRAGWETAAFVSNVVLRRRAGLDRGFDVYDDELDAGELNRRGHFERVAERSVGRARDWLAGRSGRPFFLWVHVQDPHGPYTPPAPYLGQIGEVELRAKQTLPVLHSSVGRAGIPDYQYVAGRERPGEYAGHYAEEILYSDHWIGELVAAAERASGARGLVVALTADHGESMGEGGWFFQHGHATTPDLARVPFVLVAPGLESRRVKDIVSHVDIAPTLLELAGAAPLAAASGLSLARWLGSGDPLPERLVFCDTEGEAGAYHAGGYLRAAGSAAHSRPTAADEPLRFDALEQNSEGEWRPAMIVQRQQQQLTHYLAKPAPLVAAGVMDPEHVAQLRALGYLPAADGLPVPAADGLPVPAADGVPADAEEDAAGPLPPADGRLHEHP